MSDTPKTNDCCGGEGNYHYPSCDQPKPTTGEQEMITLHATAAKLAGAEGIIVKPTTGEWTAVNGDLNTGTTEIFPLGRHRAKTIADAHNAALAAARQPKPTTGEWTPKRVEELLGFNAVIGCERIADAHNAALAAERERLEKQWGREGIHITMERLKQELAAEREKVKGLHAACRAERAGANEAEAARDEAIRLLEYKEAAQKPLVDALYNVCSVYNLPEAQSAARAALAKVKKKK